MLNQVISIISMNQGISADSVHADSHLISDLGLNSYDLITLIGKFEDEFEIEIPDRDIKNLQTVSAIAEFIKKATKY